MSERAIELAKQSINGTSKYDYFIVGIGAATFSYFAKDYALTEPFGFNENSLIAVSLLCLAISVVFGLKKIERYNNLLRENGKYLDYSKYLSAYRKNTIEGGAAINSESGEILTPENSLLKVIALEKLLPEKKQDLERLAKLVSLFSFIRDYGVFVAYGLLAFSKLLPVFII